MVREVTAPSRYFNVEFVTDIEIDNGGTAASRAVTNNKAVQTNSDDIDRFRAR